jgi:hypothetical protein
MRANAWRYSLEGMTKLDRSTTLPLQCVGSKFYQAHYGRIVVDNQRGGSAIAGFAWARYGRPSWRNIGRRRKAAFITMMRVSQGGPASLGSCGPLCDLGAASAGDLRGKLRGLPTDQSGGLAERQANQRHLPARSYWAGALLCLAPAFVRRQRAYRHSFPGRPAPLGPVLAQWAR